jgi:hypothetical protein
MTLGVAGVVFDFRHRSRSCISLWLVRPHGLRLLSFAPSLGEGKLFTVRSNGGCALCPKLPREIVFPLGPVRQPANCSGL